MEDDLVARRCFFSFHYNRDVWRSQQVRNAWVTHADRSSAGFYDASAFETYQRQGPENLKRFLNSQIEGCSVVCVLIGAQTYSRRWVRYELIRAFVEGKGLLGVRIHQLKDRSQRTDSWGYNPLDYIGYVLDTSSSILRFKVIGDDGQWQWYSDIKSIKYSELPFQLHHTNATLSSLAETYDYVSDSGYQNIGRWIETAALNVGR